MQEFFKIVVAISPSQSWRLRALKCEQTELLHLIQSAKHTSFIEMIDQALEATHNPIDLEGIKEQLQIKLAEVNHTHRMQILEEWSSPSGNSMLWKLLSQDDLTSIFFDQKS